MQPVTVSWSFFGDSGGRETGGDCGGRGGSPGTRGGCATGGACTAIASNIVDWACEGDCAAATNKQLKTVIVQILIPIPHPPIGLANPRTSATSAPDRTQQQAAHTATKY